MLHSVKSFRSYRFDMLIMGAACPESIDHDNRRANCWDCLVQRKEDADATTWKPGQYLRYVRLHVRAPLS
jgi:hypothetical protein